MSRIVLPVSLVTLLGCFAESPVGPVVPPPSLPPPIERPSGTWQALHFGGPLDDEITALHLDPDGSLVVGGFENGRIGTERIDPGGNARGFVRRLSADGAVVWERLFDSGGSDAVEAIVADEDGTLHVAGRTSGVLAGVNHGQFDTFLARVGGAGELLRLDQFGTERPQHPRALALVEDGAIVVGYEDVYIPSNYVESWENPFVARRPLAEVYVPEAEWSRTFETGPSDWAHDVVADGEGNLFVAGQAASGAERGALLWKLAPDGSRVWTVRLTTSGLDRAAAVEWAADGSILVAGTTFLALGEPNAGEQDGFVAALDPDTGAFRWTAMFGTPGSDYVTAMTLDETGDIWLTGEHLGVEADGYDLFVARLAPDGRDRAFWIGGTDADESPTAIVARNGSAIVAGRTAGRMADAGTLGGYDGFLLRVDLRD